MWGGDVSFTWSLYPSNSQVPGSGCCCYLFFVIGVWIFDAYFHELGSCLNDYFYWPDRGSFFPMQQRDVR